MDENVLRAIFDPTRFQLLKLMGEHGYCVSALALKCSLSEPAVSQHLKILREAGLVSGIKKGYYTHYRIEKEALQAVRDELDALVASIPSPCTYREYNCTLAEQICRHDGKCRKPEGES